AKPAASVRGPIPGTGVAVVRPGDERVFLRPLPVGALWGVGPRTLEKLHGLGVRTVGQLERLPLEQLVRTLGDAHGRHLHDLAHAVDPRPVVPDQRPKSISHEETFAEDIDDARALHTELVRMADAVARRARHQEVAGRTVAIKVRFGDFTTISRSVTLPQAVDTGPAIVRAATQLLDQIDIAPGVRLFGVGLANLADDAPHQLSLDDLTRAAEAPAADGAAWSAVTEAVDAVRARFGDDALLPAALAEGGSLRAKRAGEQQWGPDDRGSSPDGDRV
ncbi:MAG TPA: DNA polymerase IV, partial [Acidimicrobiaceae bacterium]|nr:DNA polymerase IV [Acidimicrobiaceae bacterium]